MPDLEGMFDALPQAVNELSTSTSTPSCLPVTIALLGASRCGKTALCKKFVGETLPAGYRATIGMELKQTTVPLDKTTVQLTLLDISGRPDYQELLWPLIIKADCVLCVFDLTNANSLEFLRKPIQRLMKEKQIVLIGARADLEGRRQVSKSAASDFAKSFGLCYFEVGVKNEFETKECLKEVCRMLVSSRKDTDVGTKREKRNEGERTQPTAPVRTRRSSVAAPKVDNVKPVNVKTDNDEDDEF